MGTTLRIAHNVFEKVRVEKDRKERLQKYEDWQKEKVKKIKALDEFKSRMRINEESKDGNVTETCITSIGIIVTSIGEEDDIDNENEFRTGARRKISKSSMKKSSTSSIRSSTDYKPHQSSTPKRTIVSKTKQPNIYETSVIEQQATYPKHSNEAHKNTSHRKRFNGWKFVKTNMNLINNNQNCSTSSHENSETKVLTSSPQRNYDAKDVYLHARDNKRTATSKKVSLEDERKKTGCGGGKQCTIC